MTTRPTFAARYWAALTDSHPPRRSPAGSGFPGRYLAALAGQVRRTAAAVAPDGSVRRRCAAFALAAAVTIGMNQSPALRLGAPAGLPPAQVAVLVDVSARVPRDVVREQLAGVRLLTRLERAYDSVPKVVDYESAADGLDRAVDLFHRDRDGPKVIFLLAGADYRVDTGRALARAREERISIWPIGYGEADLAELAGYARGGHQERCRAAPRVGAAADLVALFADARCLDRARIPAGQEGAWRRVPPGAHVVVVVDRGTKGVDVVRERHPATGRRTAPPPGGGEPEVTVLWGSPR